MTGLAFDPGDYGHRSKTHRVMKLGNRPDARRRHAFGTHSTTYRILLDSREENHGT